MRTLPTELPVAATRPLDVLLPPAPARVDAPVQEVHDPAAFAWDEVALAVADSGDRGVVAAAVAGAARHLGFSEPAADTPLVVLQRLYGRLHRAAVAGW